MCLFRKRFGASSTTLSILYVVNHPRFTSHSETHTVVWHSVTLRITCARIHSKTDPNRNIYKPYVSEEYYPLLCITDVSGVARVEGRRLGRHGWGGDDFGRTEQIRSDLGSVDVALADM